MAGHVGPLALAHDVADGAPRARPARSRSHVAVGRDAPWRNPANDCQDTPREGVGSLAHFSTLVRTCPSAAGRFVPQIAANVGATSAGVTGSQYSPGLMPRPKKMIGTP